MDWTNSMAQFWAILNRMSDVLGVLTALPMLAAAALFLHRAPVSSTAAGNGGANHNHTDGSGSLAHWFGYQ